MPDVKTLSCDPEGVQFLRAPWTYFQGWSGIWDEGRLVLYGNGGGEIPQGMYYGVPGGQLPEEEWAIEYPKPTSKHEGRPEKYWDLAKWHRLYGPSAGQHETGLVSIVRTPPTWPDDKRWLLLGSCSAEGTWGAAYRVFVGIATSPTLLGSYAPTGKKIESVHEAPINGFWPPGAWCVAGITVGDRVFVITYDPGVSASEYNKGRMHVIHELLPDLTSRRTGTVVLEGLSAPKPNAAYTWLTDAATRDGWLFALDGGDPGQAQYRHSIIEYASDTVWTGEGDIVLKKTGRVFVPPGSTTLPSGPLTWDGGYVRTGEGELAKEMILANAGLSGNPWIRGQWWMQWWSDDPQLGPVPFGTMNVEIERVLPGPVGG